MKPILLTFLFLLIQFSTLFSQSNEYFSHNESWSGEWNHLPPANGGFYFYNQVGDSIINGDTMFIYMVAGAQYGSSADTSYFFAKSDTNWMFVNRVDSDFNILNDTAIVDFSRNDSIVAWRFNQFGDYYSAMKIHHIDTLNFNGVEKRVFRMMDHCGNLDDDFIIEGLINLGASEGDYFGGCFEALHYMRCFSVNDTICGVQNLGQYEFDVYLPGTPGICQVHNLSIEDYENNGMKIYPNPFKDQIQIEVDPNQVGGVVYLYDITGKQVFQERIDNTKQHFSLSNLDSGVYQIVFRTKSNTISKRIIKE